MLSFLFLSFLLMLISLMLISVRFGSFSCVHAGHRMMTLGGLGVMGGFFVVAFSYVFSCGPMMFGCFVVVLSGLFVMFLWHKKSFLVAMQ